MDALGPYRTNGYRRISYVGNRMHEANPDFRQSRSLWNLHRRHVDIVSDPRWAELTQINSVVFHAAVSYFKHIGALFVPLPLTTRMISSPGAVYGKHALDYSSDTVPISLQWFDLKEKVYLSESSQIYLELALTQPEVDQVYSVYNSFRKEEADPTHLSEFHHIEYEGHVEFEANQGIVEECIKSVISAMLNEAQKEVSSFLLDSQIRALQCLVDRKQLFQHVPFTECLESLREDSGNDLYNRFTLDGTFGRWEEIRLTEIFGAPLAISGFPLLEVPFYHAEAPGADPPQAMNTDFIWSGYGEVVGSGFRVPTIEQLEQKSEVFNLPKHDYEPYLVSRRNEGYKPSCGFGIGWERLVQGLLCLPEISLATPFPRTHLGVMP